MPGRVTHQTHVTQSVPASRVDDRWRRRPGGIDDTIQDDRRAARRAARPGPGRRVAGDDRGGVRPIRVPEDRGPNDGRRASEVVLPNHRIDSGDRPGGRPPATRGRQDGPPGNQERDVTRRHGPPRMLTTAEVAERFGVCSHTILTWGNSGHLPYTTTTDYHGRWYHSGDVRSEERRVGQECRSRWS